MSLHNHPSFIAQQGLLCNFTPVVTKKYALISPSNPQYNGAYIDTGYIPIGNSTISCGFKFDTIGDWNNSGSCSATLDNYANICILDGSSNFAFYWGDSGVVSIGNSDTNWHIMERRLDRKLYLDNEMKLDASIYTDYSDIVSLYLFAANISTGGNARDFGALRISEFKGTASDGVTPQIDLKAVPQGSLLYGASTIAPSNCMYDIISDTYFENQGTGVFGIEPTTN